MSISTSIAIGDGTETRSSINATILGGKIITTGRTDFLLTNQLINYFKIILTTCHIKYLLESLQYTQLSPEVVLQEMIN